MLEAGELDGKEPGRLVIRPRSPSERGISPNLNESHNLTLLEKVDLNRLDAFRTLDAAHRAMLGQYPTPPPVARLMASMFQAESADIRLLDAGAGVGTLTAAFVEEVCNRSNLPKSISVTAIEIEPSLVKYLGETLDLCAAHCGKVGTKFKSVILQEDFLLYGSSILGQGLFSLQARSFNCAIMNPPYRKIQSTSTERRLLRDVGIETSNLYTGFVSVAMQLLSPDGEFVAITPRSFCNGAYFRSFRRLLLDSLRLCRIHTFESRNAAFREDEVLQENIILHGVREAASSGHTVVITSSKDPIDQDITVREVPYSELVHPQDKDAFIHIVPDEFGKHVAQHMGNLKCTLKELGLTVSTGRVVDFRAARHLRSEQEVDSVPLVYPINLSKGFVVWPKASRKPIALRDSEDTADLTIPSGFYVLVKRFTAKEERRRVVAAVYDPRRISSSRVGIENHLNYFHAHGEGISMELAKGLTAFLNSSLIDEYFRQFNGHTQVNATDLRSLKYPERQELIAVGSQIGDEFPSQAIIDRIIEEEILRMTHESELSTAKNARAKVLQTLEILKALGLPRAQQNERSALTLLALLNLKPNDEWKQASNPLIGITPMMDFFAAHYGKKYAPNSRETVRRYTVHQFMDAGIVLMNPDEARATNSPDFVYQIEPIALDLLRSFGTTKWEARLRSYLKSRPTLVEKYAAERTMRVVSVRDAGGGEFTLSVGRHSELIKLIIEDFASRFAPGGRVLYVGDTGNKMKFIDKPSLRELGLEFDPHGKMPDVVIYHVKKSWLLLVEAVTSHGPVNAKRQGELRQLFSKSAAGLVYVTAFLNRRDMSKYIEDISWETEVWIAEAPTHLIHFDGERFLGPHR